MKYFILFLVLFSILCTENKSTAQTLPNASFENWYTLPDSFGAKDPVGWTTTNYMLAVNAIHVERSVTSQLDFYSARMLPTNMNWAGTPTDRDYLASVLCNGKPTEIYNDSVRTLDVIKGGNRITAKPIKLTGYYRFVPDAVAKDSAYVIVMLKKYNAAEKKIDTVSYGSFTFTLSYLFTKFEVDIKDLRTDITADSIVVAFYNKATTKESFMDPKNVFLIDNLSLSTGTDIEEQEEKVFKSPLFPNPATNSISIPLENTVIWNTRSTVEIINSTGEKIEGYSVKYVNAENSLILENLSILPTGIYFVRILNEGKIFSYNFNIVR